MLAFQQSYQAPCPLQKVYHDECSGAPGSSAGLLSHETLATSWLAVKWRSFSRHWRYSWARSVQQTVATKDSDRLFHFTSLAHRQCNKYRQEGVNERESHLIASFKSSSCCFRYIIIEFRFQAYPPLPPHCNLTTQLQLICRLSKRIPRQQAVYINRAFILHYTCKWEKTGWWARAHEHSSCHRPTCR